MFLASVRRAAAGPSVAPMAAPLASTAPFLVSASACCGSSVPARTYVAQPRPSLTPADVLSLVRPRTRGNPRTNISVGAALNDHERDVLAAARRTGVLFFGPNCTRTVCNLYYRWVFEQQRPYVAVNPHGLVVTLDARPLLGVRKEPQKDAVAKYIAAADRALASSPGGLPVQVSGAEWLKNQANQTLPGPLEGSNANKKALRTLAEAGEGETFFEIYVQGKEHARAVSSALYSAYTSAFGVPSVEQVAQARKAVLEHRDANKRRSLIRGLKKLVADRDAVRKLRVPAGVLDGFTAAERDGKLSRK
jgi:hypothetical protein